MNTPLLSCTIILSVYDVLSRTYTIYYVVGTTYYLVGTTRRNEFICSTWQQYVNNCYKLLTEIPSRCFKNESRSAF